MPGDLLTARSRPRLPPAKSDMPPAFRFRMLTASCATCLLWVVAAGRAEEAGNDRAAATIREFVSDHCLDCHTGGDAEAELDLSSLPFDLNDQQTFARWVQVHDRIRDGEMPPPDVVAETLFSIGESIRESPTLGDDITRDSFEAEARQTMRLLAAALFETDREQIDRSGRAKVRRLNRLEYENTLQELLDAPWLQVSHQLPEDGVSHLFNKVGEQLDVSHVQMTQYLATARNALHLALNAAAHRSEKRKFYAREEPSMKGYLHYRFGQRAATRSIVPLLGLTPEPNIIRKLQPVTVGDSDPITREREAMGVFSGVYSATTKYDFTKVNAPTDGRYRLRFKTYTFVAGPNGADGGDDHGLTGGNRAWWRPDRNVASIGTRSEPVTIYALSHGGDSRWLTTFDSLPEPSVFECVVNLRKGESIRPDAARLVRTRPGWSGNPNATKAGVPGFAMNWLEVEGPLHDQWPPASYQALFGNLPFDVVDGNVKVLPHNADEDAQRLLQAFCDRAWKTTSSNNRGNNQDDDSHDRQRRGSTAFSIQPFVDHYHEAIALGEDFTGAMISAMSAVLCSPEFLYFDTTPGQLSSGHFKQRLAYFLLNGPLGKHELTTQMDVADSESIRQSVERMLQDPKSNRFINAFLDFWLDLREINANTPDSELYPEYYLDELLTESSVLETRRFFRELIDRDLPIRNLVDADFVFLNERLAEHYELPAFEGVHLRRVGLPAESLRGGLLTQASILRVTANGTTTSPVIRGAWVMERIMGKEIPNPPSGVEAVEPDIRGAKTIREQLEKHRASESCNACHARFDPPGFALESFDVAGGRRTRYRAVGDEGDAVQGFGKNGHAFKFKLAQPVDCSGCLMDGRTFEGIEELKQLLVLDERQLARNLTRRLIVYATGAPTGFSDRAEIENILDKAAASEFGVRTLIHEIVQSKLFAIK